MKQTDNFYLLEPNSHRIEIHHRANNEDHIGSLSEEPFEDPDVEHIAILSSN